MGIRLRYEKSLAFCSRSLLTRESSDALEQVLHTLLEASNASRVYIFENIDDPEDGLCMSQTHEVCVPGVASQLDNNRLHRLPYRQVSRLQSILSQGLPCCGIVETFSKEEQEVLAEQGILSILILPITINDDWMGFIGFDDTQRAREWSEDDIRLLQTAAEMIGCYWERQRTRARLQEVNDTLEQRVAERTAALRTANQELMALYAIGQMITARLHVDDVLEMIIRHIVHLLQSDMAAILLLDEAGESLTIAKAHGLSEQSIRDTKDRLGQSIAGRVAQTGIPIIANNAPNDPRFDNPAAINEGILAIASVPLKVGQKIIGTLDAYSKTNPNMFTEEHLALMTMLASQAAIAIENARLYEEVQHARDDLELRVHKRTAELLDANTQLQQEIVKRQDAETNLRMLYEQLQFTNRQKSEFLANMSHEIRTPLNTVLGFTQALQEEVYGTLNDKQHQSLDAIEQSGQHLLSLIHDILDIAKIEAGTLALDIRPVQISQICEISLLMIKQAAFKKSLRVVTQIDPTVIMIHTDERRLKQILVNLLINAVKFTNKGGEVRLAVTGDHQAQQVHFSVRDTGIGIAPEDIGRLFEPFIQLDASLSRQQEGAGLGLTLVENLTKLLGGKVSVESALGQGTCFTLSFPWNPIEDALLTASSERAGTTGGSDMPETSGEPARSGVVLIAEDNQESYEMIAEYLETIGFQVCRAKNGEEALTIARETRPDIILMDIQMPIMDGLEATRKLKADETLAAIPVLALTALAMRGDRERCLEAGADAYLSKPVGLKKLMQMINQLVGHEVNEGESA